MAKDSSKIIVDNVIVGDINGILDYDEDDKLCVFAEEKKIELKKILNNAIGGSISIKFNNVIESKIDDE